MVLVGCIIARQIRILGTKVWWRCANIIAEPAFVVLPLSDPREVGQCPTRICAAVRANEPTQTRLFRRKRRGFLPSRGVGALCAILLGFSLSRPRRRCPKQQKWNVTVVFRKSRQAFADE